MTSIFDQNSYYNEMNKSLVDKIFFADKVDVEMFIDYGCGNAAITEFLANNFPLKKYVCYDFNTEIKEKLETKFTEKPIRVTDSKDELNKILGWNKECKKCLILSSVLHEIYNYDDPAKFWCFVDENNFDYIVIRDMITSTSINKPADPNDVRLITKIYPKLVDSFTRFQGSLINNKNLIHFLLKKDFKDNWEREVRENYLILSKEELYEKIPKQYKVEYEEHYILPYFKDKCRDIGIEIRDNTHLKMILRRN
jgi:hypothetical protein